VANVETKKVEVPKPEPEPGLELIQSWNRVIKILIDLEGAWKEHRKTYEAYKREIWIMHPKHQMILNRVIHKQPFHFFLDDVSRDARVNVKNLLLNEKETN